MKTDDLNPCPIKKELFRLSSHKFIPNESGCYVLSTFEGNILYIGKATNFNVRFRQHLDDSKKINPTKEGISYWFCYLTYDSYNLEKLERSWIIQFENMHGQLPILNKISSPLS